MSASILFFFHTIYCLFDLLFLLPSLSIALFFSLSFSLCLCFIFTFYFYLSGFLPFLTKMLHFFFLFTAFSYLREYLILHFLLLLHHSPIVLFIVLFFSSSLLLCPPLPLSLDLYYFFTLFFSSSSSLQNLLSFYRLSSSHIISLIFYSFFCFGALVFLFNL